MSSANKRRTAPWQNNERHYCKVCNAWMGSDRQSILLHENGKKHQQNVEKALQEKRFQQSQEDAQNKFMADSLRQMEQAALAATGGVAAAAAVPSAAWSSQPPPPPVYSQPPPAAPTTPNNNEEEQSKKEWEAKKKQRELERNKRKKDDSDADENAAAKPPKRRKIGKDEGFYEIDDKTFLQSEIYHGILEADMPIQLWTGSQLATAQEKKLPSNSLHWQNALVLRVRKVEADTLQVDDTTPIISVTYLKPPDDEEETMEKNVALDRIRIQVGGDESIPNTLEECRLLAMGGEVVEENNIAEQVMDDATGLSGWSTVTVKKTTTFQQEREEKERASEKLRLAREAREAERHRAEGRRMEEAKVSNADDSALGAFDVWGKGDYKGIDISKDHTVSVEDTAKKLSTGATGKVAFRKAKKKKVARRTKSADDD